MFEKQTKETLKGKAIKELQGLTTEVVAGELAGLLVVVPGLGVKDTVQSVLAYSSDEEGGLAIENLTDSVVGIVEDEEDEGTVGLDLGEEDTSGKTLVVNYYKKPISTIVINPEPAIDE